MDNETNLKSAYDSLQKKELEQRKTIKQMSERIKELESLVSKNESLHLVSISLLKKYMAHVMDNEGVSFAENANDSWSNIKFTDNELQTLKYIHKEITNEY